MQLIIDSNQLTSPKLHEYLSKSPKNKAVLTDFIALEAYKGDIFSITKSMSILSLFPNQAIILSGTTKNCLQSGRCKGLQKRLIDHTQTNDFPEYINLLKRANEGDQHIKQQIFERGQLAQTHLEKMLDESRKMRDALEFLGKEYSKDERAILRNQGNYSEDMINKIVQTTFFIADTVFSNFQFRRKRPTYDELPNTFIFRACLASYLMIINRSANGGLRERRADRLRNDFVDMYIVAYGTYFDGILSDDIYLNKMYQENCLILTALFDAKLPSLKHLIREN
ncbi:hypothetical protein TRE132_21160 [Pseudomonas chlororaphis subsp. aurantiaca]|nr:hypothetical protein TRE132_21160 [Pseudomonas chlororaphis subsp. aurantiaca]